MTIRSWKAALAGLCRLPVSCHCQRPGGNSDSRSRGAMVSGGSAGRSRFEPAVPVLHRPEPPRPAARHRGGRSGQHLGWTGEARPVGAGPLIPTFSAEVGLSSRLSLFVGGEVAYNAPGETTQTNFAFTAGAHILLTDPRSHDFRVALQAAAGSDLSWPVQHGGHCRRSLGHPALAAGGRR